MQIISTICSPIYGSLRGYWIRRRRYQRLSNDNNATKRKRNLKFLRLGGKRSNRPFWKIRSLKKLRLKFGSLSSKLLMIRFRDAYVKMMLGLAGNLVSMNNGNNALGGNYKYNNKRIDKAKEVSNSVVSSLEYDEKLVSEIYKILVATSK